MLCPSANSSAKEYSTKVGASLAMFTFSSISTGLEKSLLVL